MLALTRYQILVLRLLAVILWREINPMDKDHQIDKVHIKLLDRVQKEIENNEGKI